MVSVGEIADILTDFDRCIVVVSDDTIIVMEPDGDGYIVDQLPSFLPPEFHTLGIVTGVKCVSLADGDVGIGKLVACCKTDGTETVRFFHPNGSVITAPPNTSEFLDRMRAVVKRPPLTDFSLN